MQAWLAWNQSFAGRCMFLDAWTSAQEGEVQQAARQLVCFWLEVEDLLNTRRFSTSKWLLGIGTRLHHTLSPDHAKRTASKLLLNPQRQPV